jgi:kynureninase
MRVDADYAAELDRADELGAYRSRFYLPSGGLYFDGNSLGLLSRDAEAAVLRTLEEWKTLGIEGWLSAPQPWYYLGESLGRLSAPLIGAEPDQVVVTGTTTTNLHALLPFRSLRVAEPDRATWRRSGDRPDPGRERRWTHGR